ncbi:hypothetical protein CK203_091498 [Vitis vinifera]|uniref:Uncharacterized protein n=1 Tax=Vitis vinifera TaxID=29760 RepID=A0A438CK12_VITVI|nr:hypothetical protein CK203_091498 [Vitis vinifera]
MQEEKQGEEENRVKKTEESQLQSSFALLEHFPKSIFYILYTISKLRKSRIQCFKRLFVQCYGIPPEATRYMPQAGTLRTSSQPNFEDFSSEDERLSFLSLGVRKAGQHLVSFWTPRRHPLVISCELLTGYKFVDYSLNQGAPAGHESAETPIGTNQMAPLRGSNLESNGVIATATARDESDTSVHKNFDTPDAYTGAYCPHQGIFLVVIVCTTPTSMICRYA